MAPPVMVHMMPWFDLGQQNTHWTMQRYERDGLYLWDRYYQDGRVAAHRTPLIGPYDSADEEVADLHMRLIKQTGAHGVILNWYGITNNNDYAKLKRAADVIIPAAVRADLTWSLCYEDRTFEGVPTSQWPEQLRADMEYVRDAYIGAHGGVLRDPASGRPIFIVFGPMQITTPATWAAAFEAAFPSAVDRPYVLGLDGPNTPAILGGARVLPDGDFHWPGGTALFDHVTTPAILDDFFTSFYTAAAANHFTPTMGVAFPRYQDYYYQGSAPGATPQPYWGVNVSDLSGRTFAIGISLATTGGADLIQVATWNDWQEGTSIEPSAEEGFRWLLELQQTLLGTTDEAAMTAAVQEFNVRKGSVWRYCDNQPTSDRVNCPGANATTTQEQCEVMGCCWRATTAPAPTCFSRAPQPICNCSSLRDCDALPADRLCCCTHRLPPPFPPSSPPPPRTSTFDNMSSSASITSEGGATGAIIGAIVAFVLLLGCATLCCLFRRHRRRGKFRLEPLQHVVRKGTMQMHDVEDDMSA